MSNWTPQQLREHLAKEAAKQPRPSVVAPVSREGEIHDAIEGYCRSQGWLYVHSRMDRATTTQPGVWDFIVALPGGVTLWCEVKKGKEKLSPDQLAFGAMLRRLGHHTCEARSLEDFVRGTVEAMAKRPQSNTDAILTPGGNE